MIQILDDDLPIVAAQKIICGVKPYDPTPAMKALAKAVTGSDEASSTQDMFSIDEIKEIADYLNCYYVNHKYGD